MVRRRDRVVGTLAIWTAVLVVLGIMLDRLNIINLQMQNFWYYTGSVVTGGSSEEAMEALQSLQNINNQYYGETLKFARAELLNYFPLIIILCAVLITAAVISTYFIWRSVVVPAEVSERIEARKTAERESARPLSALLNEDGEIIPPEPEHNHRRK